VGLQKRLCTRGETVGNSEESFEKVKTEPATIPGRNTSIEQSEYTSKFNLLLLHEVNL